MQREVDIYLNLNTNELVTGNQMNLDDEYTQMSTRGVINYIEDLEWWSDVNIEVYNELFYEYNIDLKEHDNNIDSAWEELKEIIYS